MITRRVVVLVTLAAVLAAIAFGPGFYRSTKPMTEQIASDGGQWTTLTSGGRSYPAVLHHIDKYCYSPGIGVIAEADSAPADSLLALATSLSSQIHAAAVHNQDLYITVGLELRHSRAWPWSEPIVLMYGYHRSASGEWKFMTYAAPPGYRPSRAASGWRPKPAA